MAIVSPLRIGLLDPFQMALSWLINRGGINYWNYITGMILQVPPMKTTIYPIFKQVITQLLTIDPKFLGHPRVGARKLSTRVVINHQDNVFVHVKVAVQQSVMPEFTELVAWKFGIRLLGGGFQYGGFQI